MHAQVAELRKELARLLERDDADERVAEAEEAGTRKGFTFEERVFDAVERIASVRNDCATHTGSEGARGRRQEGRRPGRARRCARARGRADRVRVQGQAALEARRLGRAQRRDGARAPPRSASSSSPARTGCPPGASSSTSTRATRSSSRSTATSPTRLRSSSPTGSPRRASSWPATATSTVDAAEVRVGHGGGDLMPPAGAGDQVGPDRHQDVLGRCAHGPRGDDRDAAAEAGSHRRSGRRGRRGAGRSGRAGPGLSAGR